MHVDWKSSSSFSRNTRCSSGRGLDQRDGAGSLELPASGPLEGEMSKRKYYFQNWGTFCLEYLWIAEGGNLGKQSYLWV